MMRVAPTLLVLAWLPLLKAIFSAPGMIPGSYEMDGDLLIGAIFNVHTYRSVHIYGMI